MWARGLVRATSYQRTLVCLRRPPFILKVDRRPTCFLTTAGKVSGVSLDNPKAEAPGAESVWALAAKRKKFLRNTEKIRLDTKAKGNGFEQILEALYESGSLPRKPADEKGGVWTEDEKLRFRWTAQLFLRSGDPTSTMSYFKELKRLKVPMSGGVFVSWLKMVVHLNDRQRNAVVDMLLAFKDDGLLPATITDDVFRVILRSEYYQLLNVLSDKYTENGVKVCPDAVYEGLRARDRCNVTEIYKALCKLDLLHSSPVFMAFLRLVKVAGEADLLMSMAADVEKMREERILGSNEYHHFMATYLEELCALDNKCSLWPRQRVEIATKLLKQCLQEQFPFNSAVFTKLLPALPLSVELTEVAMAEMKRLDMQVSEEGYTQAAKAFSNIADAAEARRRVHDLVADMRRPANQLGLNARIFTSLLRVAASVEEVQSLLFEMKMRGIAPTHDLFEQAIKQLGVMGAEKAAIEDVLEDMERHGVLPRQGILHRCLSLFRDDPNFIQGLLRIKMEKGGPLTPSEADVILRGLYVSGRMKDLRALLRSNTFLEASPRMPLSLHTKLVRSLIKAGELSSVREHLAHMWRVGPIPSVTMYHAYAMRALTSASDVPPKELYVDLKGRGVPFTHELYVTLMNVFYIRKDLKGCMALYSDMKREKVPLFPELLPVVASMLFHTGNMRELRYLARKDILKKPFYSPKLLELLMHAYSAKRDATVVDDLLSWFVSEHGGRVTQKSVVDLIIGYYQRKAPERLPYHALHTVDVSVRDKMMAELLVTGNFDAFDSVLDAFREATPEGVPLFKAVGYKVWMIRIRNDKSLSDEERQEEVRRIGREAARVGLHLDRAMLSMMKELQLRPSTDEGRSGARSDGGDHAVGEGRELP